MAYVTFALVYFGTRAKFILQLNCRRQFFLPLV